MGRPSKLTPDRIERFLEAIRAIAPYEMACQRAGWDYKTYRRWMQRGEEANSGKYREFYDAVKRAEADAVVAANAQIKIHGRKHWQAIAFLLERRYPEYYGRRDTMTHEGTLSINSKIAEIVNAAAGRMQERNDPGPEIESEIEPLASSEEE